MKEILKKITQRENLTHADVKEIIDAIERNSFNPLQMAGILSALETKKVTADELYYFVSELISKAEIIDLGKDCIDVCGTGGDGKNTFNISTATMFVAAGAGAKVAKHGNRAVSSSSGSYDVLEALGIDMGALGTTPQESLKQTGVAFLFAQKHHPLFKNIGPLRKELGIKTIFNVTGPLLNPGNVDKQLMGVFAPRLTETIAEVMKKKGIKRALIVHGNGLDEITLDGKTKITELFNGKIKTYELDPTTLGFKKTPLEKLGAKTKEESGAIIFDILNGKKGPARDIVVLNSAAALIIAGIAKDFPHGITLAEKSIDSKKALRVLESLKALSLEKRPTLVKKESL